MNGRSGSRSFRLAVCEVRTPALAHNCRRKGWNSTKEEAMMRGDWCELVRLSRI
jgi:hypothetical protein